MGRSARVRLINLPLWTNPLLAPGPFGFRSKSVPIGVPPRVSFRPRDASRQITIADRACKTSCSIAFLSLTLHCSAKPFSTVQTLENLLLLTVPFVVLLDFLKQVWHLPLKKQCLSNLFCRASTHKLTCLAKNLAWEDPVAQALDFEMHRWKMAGKMDSSL